MTPAVDELISDRESLFVRLFPLAIDDPFTNAAIVSQIASEDVATEAAMDAIVSRSTISEIIPATSVEYIRAVVASEIIGPVTAIETDDVFPLGPFHDGRR